MIRRSVASIVVLVSYLTVGGPASAGPTAEPVVTGKPDQFGPGGEGDEWVGWTQFVKPTFTAHIRRLNETDHQTFHRRNGSHSFFGGFDPTNDDVIFQDAKFDSNLYLYNEVTDDIGPPPDGINTDLWEWAPDISTEFILFGRNKFDRGSSPWKVMVYDRGTEGFKVLDSVENRCGCIWPESVSNNYAAWTKCEGIRCQVWVHEIDTQTTRKVPNPDEKQQYGAAVTDDGQVYFVRSGNSCGANVQIRRWDFGSGAASSRIYDYPNGTDLRGGLDVVEGADTNDDVYFDRFNCSDAKFRGNIYRILDTNVLASTSAPETGGGTATGAKHGLQLIGARPVD